MLQIFQNLTNKFYALHVVKSNKLTRFNRILSTFYHSCVSLELLRHAQWL